MGRIDRHECKGHGFSSVWFMQLDVSNLTDFDDPPGRVV